MIAIAGVLVYVFLPQITNAPTRTIQPTVVQDASVPATGDIVLSVGQKGTVGNLSIVWNGPVQDSRCPTGVQCIWAGEVQVNATISLAEYSETKKISSGKPGYLFDGHRISIVAISPQPTQGTKLTFADYQITFHIEATSDKK